MNGQHPKVLGAEAGPATEAFAVAEAAPGRIPLALHHCADGLVALQGLAEELDRLARRIQQRNPVPVAVANELEQRRDAMDDMRNPDMDLAQRLDACQTKLHELLADVSQSVQHIGNALRE